MIVHFANGENLYISDLKDWAPDDLKAFSRVVHHLGTSLDLRFPSTIDGVQTFVHARAATINYIAFDYDEHQLLTKALEEPAKAAEPTASN
jgi:hypothetical protein